MRKLVLFFAVCVLAISMQAQKNASKSTQKSVKMSSKIDSISYSIGVLVGSDLHGQLLKELDNKQNTQLLLEGLNAAINGDANTAISREEAGQMVETYMRANFEKKQKESIEKNKKFLEENAKKAGVISLPSGLQYMVVTQGTGAKPAAIDTVKVHYEGTLIDGTVFDSSIKRGEPIEFPLNQVIKGWTEGVQLMPAGSTYKLFIPADLGYGSQPAGSIPPNSTLIFEVQLLDIKKSK